MDRHARIRSPHAARTRRGAAWLGALAALAIGAPEVAAAHEARDARSPAYGHAARHHDRHHDHARPHVAAHLHAHRGAHLGCASRGGHHDAHEHRGSKHRASHRYDCDACHRSFGSHLALRSHVHEHHRAPSWGFARRIGFRTGFGYGYAH